MHIGDVKLTWWRYDGGGIEMMFYVCWRYQTFGINLL